MYDKVQRFNKTEVASKYINIEMNFIAARTFWTFKHSINKVLRLCFSDCLFHIIKEGKKTCLASEAKNMDLCIFTINLHQCHYNQLLNFFGISSVIVHVINLKLCFISYSRSTRSAEFRTYSRHINAEHFSN